MVGSEAIRDERQNADRLEAEARLDVRVMALEAGRRRARPRALTAFA